MFPNETKVLRKNAMLRICLLILALTAAPAMAEHKLFLSCTNGRDPQTNEPFPDPNFPVVVDLDARTLSPNSSARGFPVDRLDDQAITAHIRGKIDPETDSEMTLIIDRIGGHLSILWMVFSNCDQPGMPKGRCISRGLYDCSSTPPKPKF
jgi:hypothetical protein